LGVANARAINQALLNVDLAQLMPPKSRASNAMGKRGGAIPISAPSDSTRHGKNTEKKQIRHFSHLLAYQSPENKKAFRKKQE